MTAISELEGRRVEAFSYQPWLQFFGVDSLREIHTLHRTDGYLELTQACQNPNIHIAEVDMFNGRVAHDEGGLSEDGMSYYTVLRMVAETNNTALKADFKTSSAQKHFFEAAKMFPDLYKIPLILNADVFQGNGIPPRFNSEEFVRACEDIRAVCDFSLPPILSLGWTTNPNKYAFPLGDMDIAAELVNQWQGPATICVSAVNLEGWWQDLSSWSLFNNQNVTITVWNSPGSFVNPELDIERVLKFARENIPADFALYDLQNLQGNPVHV